MFFLSIDMRKAEKGSVFVCLLNTFKWIQAPEEYVKIYKHKSGLIIAI